jgi:hypothetical protein
MIHGTKNYIRNVKLGVAIGLKQDNNQLSIIGGPTGSVLNQTKLYMDIVPGKQSSSYLAKQIRNRLSAFSPKELKKEILKISIDEIQRFIPSGRSDLKEKR